VDVVRERGSDGRGLLGSGSLRVRQADRGRLVVRQAYSQRQAYRQAHRQRQAETACDRNSLRHAETNRGRGEYRHRQAETARYMHIGSTLSLPPLLWSLCPGC